MRMRIRSPTYCRDKEKRQAQKTLPTKTEKGEAKIAVRQADKKRLVFLLGFAGKQKFNKKQQICDFGYALYGIFQQRSRCTADSRRGTRCRSWYLGRDQPAGRLRQR